LPGRRHGSRQDAHHARSPRGAAGAAPGDLPALGRAQLGGRGRQVHSVHARCRAPRHRPQRRLYLSQRRRPARHDQRRTTSPPATSRRSRRFSGRLWCSTRPKP
jgi:hypothetical protein